MRDDLYSDRDEDFVDSFYSKPSKFNNMAYNNNNRGNWNNNNGGYNGGYNNGGYNNNGNRGYYNNQNYNNNQRPKKHSGATFKNDKNGNPIVIGWNYSKTLGMRSFICSPYKGTKRVTSQSGQEWENWFVKCTVGGQVMRYSGMFNLATKKVIIKDLGMVMNPAKDYCGAFFKRKQR